MELCMKYNSMLVDDRPIISAKLIGGNADGLVLAVSRSAKYIEIPYVRHMETTRDGFPDVVVNRQTYTKTKQAWAEQQSDGIHWCTVFKYEGE